MIQSKSKWEEKVVVLPKDGLNLKTEISRECEVKLELIKKLSERYFTAPKLRKKS